jgi:hypothetical protein
MRESSRRIRPMASSIARGRCARIGSGAVRRQRQHGRRRELRLSPAVRSYAVAGFSRPTLVPREYRFPCPRISILPWHEARRPARRRLMSPMPRTRTTSRNRRARSLRGRGSGVADGQLPGETVAPWRRGWSAPRKSFGVHPGRGPPRSGLANGNKSGAGHMGTTKCWLPGNQLVLLDKRRDAGVHSMVTQTFPPLRRKTRTANPSTEGSRSPTPASPAPSGSPWSRTARGSSSSDRAAASRCCI